jgi:hypothetical protein
MKLSVMNKQEFSQKLRFYDEYIVTHKTTLAEIQQEILNGEFYYPFLALYQNLDSHKN